MAEPEVSQPGEPAEKEADAVGDKVASELHESRESGGAATNETGDAPKEQAPAIGAKLSDGKVMRAKKDAAAPSSPPSTAPGKVDLKTACAADPLAQHKYNDVMNETQPRAVAARPAFLKEAERALQAAPTQPLQAMRSVVRGGSYFFLGNEIPEQAIIDAKGLSRVVDLPSLWKYSYVDPSVRNRFKDENAFVAWAATGGFDPTRDIDDRKLMKGAQGVKETWWFPSAEANAVDLDQLRQQLYIQDNPSYAQGAIRFDVEPADVSALGLKAYKPTAFDGMMQGWGNDPWWITKPGTWGITKNNTHEAVMRSQTFRFYKKRTLIMPSVKPPAPGGAPPPVKAGKSA
jgi:hypothetical protein